MLRNGARNVMVCFRNYHSVIIFAAVSKQPYVSPKVIWKQNLSILYSIIRRLRFKPDQLNCALSSRAWVEFQCGAANWHLQFVELNQTITFTWDDIDRHISPLNFIENTIIPTARDYLHHSQWAADPTTIPDMRRWILWTSFSLSLLHNYSPLRAFDPLFSSRFVCSKRHESRTRQRETTEPRREREGTMESILSEQSATVDELVEACIQAFGWSQFLWFISIIPKRVRE